MSHPLAQFVIGGLLGVVLHRTLKDHGLTVDNPATRPKTLLIMVLYGGVAAVALELVDTLTG